MNLSRISCGNKITKQQVDEGSKKHSTAHSFRDFRDATRAEYFCVTKIMIYKLLV
jgi:hypothetical protein